MVRITKFSNIFRNGRGGNQLQRNNNNQRGGQKQNKNQQFRNQGRGRNANKAVRGRNPKVNGKFSICFLYFFFFLRYLQLRLSLTGN